VGERVGRDEGGGSSGRARGRSGQWRVASVAKLGVGAVRQAGSGGGDCRWT
jgi:hypothetical protein